MCWRWCRRRCQDWIARSTFLAVLWSRNECWTCSRSPGTKTTQEPLLGAPGAFLPRIHQSCQRGMVASAAVRRLIRLRWFWLIGFNMFEQLKTQWWCFVDSCLKHLPMPWFEEIFWMSATPTIFRHRTWKLCIEEVTPSIIYERFNAQESLRLSL